MSSIPDLHGLTVLAVDDLEDNLDLIEDFLEDEVWAVHKAESGEEAISLAVKHKPDIVLLDLMMPRINGLAVLRAIRSDETLKDTIVVLQTAYADRNNIATARRMGCDRILCKPLNRDRLLDELRRCAASRCKSDASGGASVTDTKASESAVRGLLGTVKDASTLVEAGRLVDDGDHSQALDCFRKLIPDDSPIGERLIRLANSPAAGGRYPVRTTAEAIIRIGIRETKSLIQKSSSAPAGGVSRERVIESLNLLEVITYLFPDRTATTEGTLSLLADLNSAGTASSGRDSVENSDRSKDAKTVLQGAGK